MWKKNKVLIIVTAIICLLPILAGVILWDQLPEQIPTHWGINGEVDSWSSKTFAVFGFPALLAGIHLLCVFFTKFDPKATEQPKQMLNLVMWICPVISLLMGSVTYCVALGHDLLNMPVICCCIVGVMFIIVGNYLPKCRQSYTMGIKLPWTLADEGNWNATHRVGGWTWMLCGVVMLATAFLGIFWILLGVLLVAVIVPTVYSYVYYRKHKTRAEDI
jgi:uncharacterized membrane protein